MAENKLSEIEQSKIEDFIKTLNKEELHYINSLVVQRLDLLYQQDCLQSMARFNIGEPVEFTSQDGIVIHGNIVKMNRKTVVIRTPEMKQWKVSPEILRSVR